MISRRSGLLPLLLALAPACHAQDDAIAILKQAAETQGKLKNWRIDEEIDGERSSEMQHSWSRERQSFAITGDNKVRFEYKGEAFWYIVVSDGKTLWRAAPYLRQWSRTPVNAPLAEMKGGGEDGRRALTWMQSFLKAPTAMTDGIRRAEIVREEPLEVGGVPYDCTVVRADYDAPHTTGIRSISRTFWIDKARHLVLREDSVTGGYLSQLMTPFQESESRRTRRVTFLSIDQPMVDSVFTYTAPANFREVAVLERESPRHATEMTGKPAPDLKLDTLDGKPVSLADYRGRTVLLDFWATWCEPCRESMPAMAKLYGEIKTQNAVLIGIDDDEETATPRTWLKERGYDWLNLFGGAKTGARDAYRVDGVPTFVVIDAKGIIQAYQVGSGPQTDKAIRDALRKQGIQLAE